MWIVHDSTAHVPKQPCARTCGQNRHVRPIHATVLEDHQMANMRSRNLAIMYVHGLGYWVKRRLQGVGSRRGPASSERVSPKGMPQRRQIILKVAPPRSPCRGAGQGHQLFSMQTAGMPQLAHLYKLELANTAQTHSEA